MQEKDKAVELINKFTSLGVSTEQAKEIVKITCDLIIKEYHISKFKDPIAHTRLLEFWMGVRREVMDDE